MSEMPHGFPIQHTLLPGGALPHCRFLDRRPGHFLADHPLWAPGGVANDWGQPPRGCWNDLVFGTHTRNAVLGVAVRAPPGCERPVRSDCPRALANSPGPGVARCAVPARDHPDAAR